MRAKCLRVWLALVACGLLCGCFDVEDELTIKPDGSGSVVLKLRTSAPRGNPGPPRIHFEDDEGPALYPPVNESEAGRFFPRKEFTVTVEEPGQEGSLTVRAAFKSVQALVNSPYGRAHQLLLQGTNAGELSLTAIPGGEAMARAACVDPGTDLKDLAVADPAALIRKRQEMKFVFRVRLPGLVTRSNGQHQDQAVTWSFARAGSKDDAEFLARLAERVTATCQWNTPLAVTNPVRLALTTWTNLADGVAQLAAGAPAADAIVAAAKVVPETLRVGRLVDLSGSGGFGGQGNVAQLTGYVELPPALAPQKWGAPKLTEATDNLGNSLLINATDDGLGASDFRYRYGLANSEGSRRAATPASRQPFTLAFRSPEWKAKTIATLKGEIELTYAGGVEVVKLSNAVPTNAIVAADPESMTRANVRQRAITDPRLSRLGVSLVLQSGMVMQGGTLLMLESRGKAPLLDFQVFDKDGRPWPTAFAATSGTALRVIIPGKPAPPLSLALAVGAGGTGVKVPFAFEQVPVAATPAKEATP